MGRVGFCQFHKREEPLCKAHIYPRFLYALEERGREGAIRAYGRDGTDRRIPGGLYDPDILCSEADSYLGGWLDDFAAGVFEQIPTPTAHQARRGEIMCAKGDVGRFKSFLISLLWRAHISTRSELLECYVGERKAEEFFGILSDQREPTVRQYAFILRRYDIEPREGIFAPPTRVRISGMTCYDLVFGPYSCLVWTDSRKPPSLFAECANMAGDTIKIFTEDFWASRLAKAGLSVARDHLKAKEHPN